MRMKWTTTVTLLVAALLVAGCGDKKTTTSSGGGDPKKNVVAALANVPKIKTGIVTVDGTISGGGTPGSVSLKGSGPFDFAGKKGPAVNLELEVGFAGTPQKIGLVVYEGETFIVFGGRAISMGKARKGAAGPLDLEGLKNTLRAISQFVSDVKEAGTTKVDGESVTLYSAKVDVAGLANKFGSKAKSSSSAALPGIPSVSDLKNSPPADVKIGVDADGLPRYIFLETTLGSAQDGQDAGSIEATATLTKVNQPVSIEPPKNPLRGDAAQALGGMFGGGMGQ